jgi:hypothetical protein
MAVLWHLLYQDAFWHQAIGVQLSEKPMALRAIMP